MCIRNKRRRVVRKRKRKIRQTLQRVFRTFWWFFSHIYVESWKICQLTWMWDCNQKDVRLYHGYLLTLALSHLITKAIVFSAIIQCIQEFLHWNIICHVQISDPINKICTITIPNFTNSKSICYNSISCNAWWRLSCAFFAQRFIYTVKKNTDNTFVPETHSSSVKVNEAMIDKLDTYFLSDALLCCWLADAMLPPAGLM